ncbi:hypothetical protein MMC22_011472 [Lobaria immixta]|nr:hypothetical protein [Lobaria immixta]
MADPKGLSARMSGNIAAILPKIASTIAERTTNGPAKIDLSTAENWLLRPELLALCRDVISRNLTTDVHGFDFHFRIRANVNIIVVNLPAFSLTLTSALLPALASAFSSAPDPNRIKALVLTNPHNPFGQCYPADVLRKCVRFCRARTIHFVSDEVYAMSEFASSAGPAAPFVSALALDTSTPGSEEEQQIDRSRVHVIWSTSKDFGSSGIRMGCIVSQANQPLLTGVALASSTQTSSLSSVFVAALLTSPKLPSLMAMNKRRLAESYQIVAAALRQWNVEFIPAHAGLFVFAKLAKEIRTWEEEAIAVERLKESGVLVGSGRAFHVMEGEKGWMRMTFALPEDMLRAGLKKVQSCLQLVKE